MPAFLIGYGFPDSEAPAVSRGYDRCTVQASIAGIGQLSMFFACFRLLFSASRPIITDVDLKGHTVLTIKRGVSESCDRMCDDLMKAGIAIEEVEIYSTSVLIECMENDKPVIIPDC